MRRYVSRQPWNLQSVALIGDQAGLISLRNRIERHPEWRIDVKLEIVPAGVSGSQTEDEDSGESGSGIPALNDRRRFAARQVGAVPAGSTAGVDRTMLVGGEGVFGDFASKTDLIQRAPRRRSGGGCRLRRPGEPVLGGPAPGHRGSPAGQPPAADPAAVLARDEAGLRLRRFPVEPDRSYHHCSSGPRCVSASRTRDP